MHVYSEVNRGTTFRVYLPADVSPEIFRLVLQPPAALLRRDGQWVLVVDDEEPLRRAAGRILERRLAKI
jgi:hypothetical protein